MISQTAEYALRAAVFLAENTGGQTTEQISQATKIPNAYLAKVLQLLSRSSIVQSQRGLGGGFTLKIAASKLTVLDVVNAVDPIERIRECPLDLDAHATKLCPLHRRLDEATALVERAFGDTRISDLLAGPNADNIYTFPRQDKRKKKNTPAKKKGR
ncbi:MAG: Rrf2 family transcriptional regulator [Candidatus Obscuribacterales bacterium]|nr:Rrf2 family transcriptional regulator [Candidatus Obscuribacterales bacterium]HNB21812.1 Rrf2 family transcriptional regulator [Candidatus Melainabacteria bacterium]